MAVGYPNAGTLNYTNWTGLATPGASAGLVQNVASPGWARQIGDATAIDAADNLLRRKVGSGRLEPNGITTSFFYYPQSGGLDSPPITVNILTLTYPPGMLPVSPYIQLALVNGFSIGNFIDDEISVCECEFMPSGAEAFFDPTTS